MSSILTGYAKLLVQYCLDVQHGEKVYIKSSALAEPLLKLVHDEVLKVGGHPFIHIQVAGTEASFYELAHKHQLEYVNELEFHALSNFDCYLVIRAPHNLRELNEADAAKRNLRSEAMKELNQIYFQRTGNGELKRCLCQYATNAAAQEAGMSLEKYKHFIYQACGLYENDPVQYWLNVREKQQKLVDFLNRKEEIRFKNDLSNTDIHFSVKGRSWMNSDGRNNMPSGEVFTAPVEDSVNGKITFNYASVYRGKEVRNVQLRVKDGYIESWNAESGKDILNEVFDIEGARRFGEAAIGTNYHIQQITKNILFDEKIGGSVHMAVGQAYKQCGGKNESTVHWDLITDMKNGGQIFADGELFYESGRVVVEL